MNALLTSRRNNLISAIIIAALCACATSRAALVAAWGRNEFGQCQPPNGLKNVRAVAAGAYHSLALKDDGKVVAWGANSFGQTNVPPGLSDVIAIAAGFEFSLALKANGTVAAWGYNLYGQTNIPPGLSNVTAIAAGYYHSMALKTDGTVIVWHDAASNQPSFPGGINVLDVPLGLSNVTAIAASQVNCLALKADGTVVAWGVPPAVQTNTPIGLSNVVAIAAGDHYNAALKADGTVLAWGHNNQGQTTVPPGLSNVVAIAASDGHNVALKADGSVVAWGSNTFGESSVPPALSSVAAIAAGRFHNLALVFDGPIEILQHPQSAGIPYTSNATFSVTAAGREPLGYRWYRNGFPLTDTERVSGAASASLLISNTQFSDSGTYSVIVSNAFVLVQSTGAVLTVISPPIITLQPVGRTVIAGTNVTLTAAATGTPPLSYRWLFNGTPLASATGTLLTLSNIQSSQSGNYSLLVSNTYGATESSNAVVTVLDSPPYILNQPSNRSGFLGGTATFSVNARGSTPLHYQWRFNGTDIPGATNVALTLTSLRYDQAGLYSVAVSNAFGVTISAKAQLSVNSLAVWGSSAMLTNVPPGLTNLIAISAGEDHLLALKADGTVAAWGRAISFWPPGSANPLTNVPSGLNGVTALAAGLSHNLALRSNGTIVAWGDNSYGQTNVPAGLSNVVSVAAGDLQSLALKADGKVVAWGARGTFLPPSGYASLTNVPPGLSNVVAIAAGSDHNLALKNDGRVIAWGLPGATNVPASLSNVIAIACGEVASVRPAPTASSTFNLALRADGTVVSWVAGTYSQPPYPWIIPTIPPVGLSNVVGIAARGHGMALKTDGSVVMWGLTNPPPPQGLSNTIAVAAGYGFAAAIAGDGSPRFTIQPASQIVANGAKVQHHARAVGVQPLSYQWQREGANLPGATSADLMITNAQGKDTGNYRVLVSNALGAATSSLATLSIPFSTNLATALNTTNLIWTSGTPSWPWFAQIRETHDGNVAAQSGQITNGQQSVLQTTVIGPGTLTFWWKVSSEEGYDRLWFNVDVMSSIRAISGETDWQQVVMPIPTGAHVVRWVYSKDATVSAGQDAGWVDEVVFTPAAPLTLTAPRLLPDGSFAFDSSDPSGRILSPANLALIEVQASTNLHDWVTLTGGCTLTNGVLLFRDPDGTDHPSRFFRIVEHW